MQWLTFDLTAACSKKSMESSPSCTASSSHAASPSHMASPSHKHLVSETQQRIIQLERAIKDINGVKASLKHNAIEVKSDICAVFSQQLESLRKREIWLLNQVETIQQAKDEKLRTQQDRLCRLLGGLQAGLSYSGDGEVTENSNNLDRKLSESLDRLDKLNLKPQETSHMCFRANVAKLQEAIDNFGLVDPNRRPRNKAFVPPSAGSACMPQVFEDYGDAEHMVLYKTVQEVCQERSQDDSIAVHIPKLEKSNPAWLSYSPTTSDSLNGTPTSATEFVFPTHDEPASLSTHSLQHWLAQIKNQTEVEGDDCDFEVLAHPRRHTESEGSESIELISSPDSAPSKISSADEVSFPHLSTIASSNSDGWLHPSSVHDAEAESATVQRFSQTLDHWKMWLDQTQKDDGCCNTACVGTTVKAVDIENLDQLVCTSVSAIVNDEKKWLQKEINDEKDVDEREGIEKICCANEVCNSLSECLHEDTCSPCSPLSPAQSITGLAHLSSNVADWLRKPKSSTVIEDIQASPLLGYLQSLSTNNSDWLASESKPVIAGPAPCEWVQSIFKGKAEDWIKRTPASPSRQMASPQCSKQVFSHMMQIQESDNRAWLEKSSPKVAPKSPPESVSPVLSHMVSIQQANNSMWLQPTVPASPSHSKAPPNFTHLQSIVSPTCDSSMWLKSPSPMPTPRESPLREAVITGLKKIDAVASWLSPLPPAPPEKSDDTSTSFDFLTETNSSKWLLTDIEATPKDNILINQMNTDYEDDSVWLMRKESTPSTPEHETSLFKLPFEIMHGSTDNSKWLACNQS